MNELEAKRNQFADNLLVQTSLAQRFERRAEDRFVEHEPRIDRIETAETIDRFIRGRHGDRGGGRTYTPDLLRSRCASKDETPPEA
jgi:hypothetical protein